MSKRAVCTIVAPNYRSFAETLMSSVAAVHPEWDRYVLFVSDETTQSDLYKPLNPSELGIPELSDMKFRYSALELSTALKPWLLKYLLKRHSKAAYFDPDIKVYSELKALKEESNISLTPHMLSLFEDDGKHPAAKDILGSGTFNLGFISLTNCAETEKVLNWWSNRSIKQFHADPAAGTFTDQKWIDFLPSSIENLNIIRDPSYNIAYWNLHERLEVPPTFFHFSGLNPESPGNVSKHQDRHLLSNLPENTKKLFLDYSKEMLERDHSNNIKKEYPYSKLLDGTLITSFMKCFYYETKTLHRKDPLKELTRKDFCGLTSSGQHQIPEILYFLWKHRIDLQARFPSPLAGSHKELCKWAIDYGLNELESGSELKNHLRELCKEIVKKSRFNFFKPKTPRSLGVNLIGYTKSEMGVGQAARLTTQALKACDVSVLPFDISSSSPSRAEDNSVKNYNKLNPSFVNLFQVNADQLKSMTELVKQKTELGFYNIGTWYWELPELPEKYHDSYELVQELWAPTQFIQNALSHSAPVPVTLIKPPITVEDPGEVERFSREKFSILMMYDMLSVQERKNPLSALEAFRRADIDALLAIKVMSAKYRPELLEELKAYVDDDPRISIIEDTLSRKDVFKLQKSVDCYISLHRSEGLGLGIAESMLFEKPCVVTNWSGNTDFCNAETACLVDYRLKKLEKDFGPYPKDATWAEPDIDNAAWWLKKIFYDQALGKEMGKKAKNFLETNYNPQTCGAAMKERLERILKFS